MKEATSYLSPVSISRPRGSRIIEAFSPKLNRRLQCFGHPAFDLWICLESDPSAVTFCERPAYADPPDNKTPVDFWVRYSGREEFLMVNHDGQTPATLVANGSVSVRVVPEAELAASRCWISNWERILPCIVASRGYVTDALMRATKNHVSEPMPLSRIEREMGCGDPTLARAATFSLLHAGHLGAPRLKVEPLSLQTVFEPVEVH